MPTKKPNTQIIMCSALIPLRKDFPAKPQVGSRSSILMKKKILSRIESNSDPFADYLIRNL